VNSKQVKQVRTKLMDGEEVLFIAKKHLFYVLIPLLGTVGLMFLYIYAGIHASLAKYPIIQQTILIMFLLGVGLTEYRILNRKYDIWVVTTNRVIDEWGIVAHNFKEMDFANIQNMTYMQNFLGLIFGFGDIRLQTSATEGTLTDTFVENPKYLKKVITEQKELYKQMKERQAAEISAKALSEAMAKVLAEKQQQGE